MDGRGLPEVEVEGVVVGGEEGLWLRGFHLTCILLTSIAKHSTNAIIIINRLLWMLVTWHYF